ncbi:dual specificity protein kinase shkC-like [Gigantopelta aegis]|uniref:dual specificity protein kinase shkC-like n=1 Tax=Gigantopelta aegis TaxID=1735272 RepID=UPI001B88807E|nr:dual specificity protein kinase shkC-like [Gigantopelta aegis]
MCEGNGDFNDSACLHVYDTDDVKFEKKDTIDVPPAEGCGVKPAIPVFSMHSVSPASFLQTPSFSFVSKDPRANNSSFSSSQYFDWPRGLQHPRSAQHISKTAKAAPLGFYEVDPPRIRSCDISYEMDEDGLMPKIVGIGSFGRVFLARLVTRGKQKLVAVKEFNLRLANRWDIYQEARILLYLQVTGYVPFCYGLVQFGSVVSNAYGIVQEFFGDGLNLEKFLWQKNPLPESRLINLARQLAEGLYAIHQLGIILNDIKPNNILLENSHDDMRIKYCDMGMATFKTGMKFNPALDLEDFLHLAPEVRMGELTSKSSDVYSLGYILDEIRVFTNLDAIIPAIDSCYLLNPRDRPTANDICSVIEDIYTAALFRDITCDN